MASSQTNENTATPCKTCQRGEGDKNVWNTKSSESSDKQQPKCPNCQILKSGPLFLSSKGIGWTSWKKRWFVLTQTSLVFYRSDPNAPPQKGCEANPTLGGIDLNSSGSVVVKPDKKLLTVFFPDGRDGRTFTLKAETSEELQEWKTALENALAQAPSAAVVMGQNGILRNEIADSVEASFEQRKDKKPVSMVIGRPVLLALEEADGSPSFLEKALRFIEEYGIRVEGVLRQSADVEEVERREQEYEQGKTEFSSGEDAHIIGDCIKHVLREMPSSPVPASCCTALVEAYRIDRGNRINAIRAAIAETFPEPNLRLLQRCLKMMKTVAAHRSENRMSLSALAACMAPLLLRPLLAGDCEFEDSFNMGGDGSLQLLKAAAAANHAQAIVIIMLEEYERIFDEELSQDGSFSSDVYTETEEDDIEYDESTDNDILEDHGYHDVDNGLDADNEDDLEHSSRSSRSSRSSSGTLSGSGSYLESDQSDNEEEDHSSDSSSHGDAEDLEAIKGPSSTIDATTSVQDNRQKPSPTDILTQEAGGQKNGLMQNENSNSAALPNNRVNNSTGDVHTSIAMQKSASHAVPGSSAKLRKSTASMRRSTKRGHTSARKNVPLKSVDCSTDDEIAIQKLEATKSELESKVAEEVKGNAILKESLERRKDALRERRLALEKDVEVLQEQLQKERDFKASLESGLTNMRPRHVSNMSAMDSKTRADLEEINLAEADIINLTQKAADLRGQLIHLQPSDPPLCISCKQQLDGKENRKDLEKIVDSGLPQQNEYSLTTDVCMSSVAFGNVQPQRQDLLSSPNRVTSQKASPQPASQTKDLEHGVQSSTEKLSAAQIASSPADSEDVKRKSKTSSSRKDKPGKQKLSTVDQFKMLPLESVSISSNEIPAEVAMNAAPNNFSSRRENPTSGASHENRRPQAKDSIPSIDKNLSQELLRGDEALSVTSDSSSKKSTSKGENPKSEAEMDTEYGKAQNQNSPTLADAQTSQKLPRQTTRSRTKSNDTSSTEEPITLTRNFASKRSSFRADKQELQDLPTLSNKQLSQRQQLSTTSVKSTGQSDDTTALGRNASSKKSFKSEDAATSSSSSSALTRLTNRLNFLKERRVQLANELQNLDANANRTSGPEQPPKTDAQ